MLSKGAWLVVVQCQILKGAQVVSIRALLLKVRPWDKHHQGACEKCRFPDQDLQNQKFWEETQPTDACSIAEVTKGT